MWQSQTQPGKEGGGGGGGGEAVINMCVHTSHCIMISFGYIQSA